MTINYEDFVEQYIPVLNHIDENAGYGGCLFETFGEEREYIWKLFTNPESKHYVWTLIEGEYESLYIVPGFSIIDRLGFMITEKPWTNENIVVNDNEMCTIEEAVDYCINFAKEHLKITLDRFNVNNYFLNNIKSTFNNEITLGQAKYTAIDYYDYALNVDADDIEDEIYNYYSQLN